MRFRLVEDLQEDLQEEHKEQERIIKYVSDELTSRDFTTTNKLNGISFNKEISKDNVSIICQFYIDTTSFDYSSYIKFDDETNESNYSNKGTFDNVENGLKQFIFQLEGI